MLRSKFCRKSSKHSTFFRCPSVGAPSSHLRQLTCPKLQAGPWGSRDRAPVGCCGELARPACAHGAGSPAKPTLRRAEGGRKRVTGEEPPRKQPPSLAADRRYDSSLQRKAAASGLVELRGQMCSRINVHLTPHHAVAQVPGHRSPSVSAGVKMCVCGSVCKYMLSANVRVSCFLEPSARHLRVTTSPGPPWPGREETIPC